MDRVLAIRNSASATSVRPDELTDDSRAILPPRIPGHRIWSTLTIAHLVTWAVDQPQTPGADLRALVLFIKTAVRQFFIPPEHLVVPFDISNQLRRIGGIARDILPDVQRSTWFRYDVYSRQLRTRMQEHSRMGILEFALMSLMDT